jgi:AAHS family 4-hydroxybenzoate transporter-like MFS transporter
MEQRISEMRDAASAVLDARPIGRLQAAILLLGLATLLLDGLDLQLLPFLSPPMVKELGANPLSFSPALAAGMAGMVIGNPLGGILGDRVGRKWVLAVAVAAFGLGMILTAWVHDVGALTTLRFLCGIGFGAAMPNVLALAADWTPLRWQTQAIGWLQMGPPLGSFCAALLAMVILPTLGWRGCFVVCGSATMVLCLALVWRMFESPSYLLRRGFAVKAKAILKRAAGNHLTTPDLALPPQVEPGRRQSIFSRVFLRVNLGVSLSIFATSYTAFGLMAWMPLILVKAGVSMGNTAQSLIYFTVMALISAPISAWVAARLGSRTTGLVGLAFALIAVVAVGVVMQQGAVEGIWRIRAALALSGLSLGGVQVVLYAIASTAYPPESRAGGIGVATAASRLGGVITMLGGGAILSLVKGSLLGFLAALSVSIVFSAIGLLIIDRHIPPRRLGGLAAGRPVTAQT